ncbi:TnsD family Tn7-like transposition protein [Photobacterium aquimaris]|uniref:Transposase n=1 Tax=Photobacterium aquimaris TaxID=512643 RepID=A0A2T3HVR0_9GAMM|nr:TnsD family Tn7-like transposition protein [Photobacterium aquimaris]OBU20669.1 transposase [Photobacterium aquimaris]PQJ37422.1 transposase [Photobacterium aquimaris]PSU02761.1 transposase [Photobacterium aquimaris]
MKLPKALPDESLFSRICRHLAICELPLEQALQQLVGDGRAVIHPYLTSNLHLISQFTDESPQKLLSCQTLRPLFSYFLPKYRTVLDDVTAASNCIVRASQLSTFRDKEPLSVKYCPLCAKDDVYDFGVAYWHLSHQVSGVEACLIHKAWLVHHELPNRIHINGHLLPDTGSKPIYCNELALEFAQFVSNQIKILNAKKPSYEVLCNAYLKKLSINGSLTLSGRVKRKEITQELFELSEELFPTQSALSLRTSVDFRFVSSLISGQYPQHPFKHLLFEFYLSRCQSSSGTRLFNVQKVPINKEEQCCDLLRSGLSMAAVSREIDKSRCYVKSIALKNDIPVNLKPKKITRSLKASIVNLAKKGFHRSALAKLYSISTGSVELIISTTSGLVEWRKRCKWESLRRRYSCQIIRFIASTPNACRQEIKNSYEAAFHWLYINEREWLEKILPVATQTQRVEKVDWYQRDLELVVEVRKLLFSSNSKLSRTELDRFLGGHGWLTSKLEKLPKTRKLLRNNGLL